MVSRFSARFALLAFIALFAIVATATVATAATRPPGAVKLTSAKLKKVGKVNCGRFSSAWLPGTRLKGNYFVTHTRQAKTFKKLAKKTKSAKKMSAYTKKAKKFTRLAKNQAPACKPKPGGTTPGSGSGGSDYIPPPIQPQGTGAPVKFNVAGAMGLALKPASAARSTRQQATTGSNLSVVAADGTTKDAVTSGTLTIDQFLIAPNGKLYALLRGAADLDGSGGSPSTCILAEVDVATGTPTCIDSTLSQIDTRTSIGGSKVKAPVIQFDSKGAIYYTGATQDGKRVLRKFLGGVTTDLISDNVYLTDFLVRPDDGVLISGRTISTQADWTRRVAPTGGLTNLANAGASWMASFPDGAYFGFNAGGGFGVKRSLTEGAPVGGNDWWIANSQYLNGGTVANDTLPYCSESGAARGVCMDPHHVNFLHTTTDDKVFAVAGNDLFTYWPSLSHQPTMVDDIKVAQGVITNLVLAGLNTSGQNVTTVLNTSTGQEKTLIGPDNEVEVYHVNYVANGNKVMFDGLRFSDNKYVIGQVPLGGGTVTMVPTDTKWADLQSFG